MPKWLTHLKFTLGSPHLENVQTKFIKNKEVHSYRTRNREKLHVSSVKSHIKYISVNNQGVKLWNELENFTDNNAKLIN